MKPQNVTLAWMYFLGLLQTMAVPGRLPGMSSAAPCLSTEQFTPTKQVQGNEAHRTARGL